MSKHKGDIAELRFQLDATKQGIAVSIPVGDRFPYDFIAGVGKELYKVQVKSIFSNRNRRMIRKTNNNSYEQGDFDFLALFNNNEWFIIPFDSFGVSVDLRAKKYAKYKDNWEFNG